MSQRELPAEMIEQTVAQPDRVQENYKRRYLAQKGFHGSILEVAYREEAGQIILITAYWLTEKG